MFHWHTVGNNDISDLFDFNLIYFRQDVLQLKSVFEDDYIVFHYVDYMCLNI